MKLNIAILGTRGIPNRYGGFEFVAAELSAGFAEKGHTVTVYCSHRHPYTKAEWNGVQLIHCFDPEYAIGTTGQFIYDFNCIRAARKKNHDIILMLGYTSSSVWNFLYPRKAVVITNMDGLEWQRSKYGPITKRFLKYAEKKAIQPGQFYIADSPVIKKYLDEKYHIDSKYIAYSAPRCSVPDETLISEYGLTKRNYFMLMARLEPENNIEMILDGFCASVSEMPVIVIGNTGNKFGTYLVRKFRDEPRIRFTGAIYEENRIHSLTACCGLYFHGHSVGGTNPSLLAAMAARAPVAAHDNPFNRSVLKQHAFFFTDARGVRDMINTNQYCNEEHILQNAATIQNEFTRDMITKQYEDYFTACYQTKNPL